jgi:co-chaperonin GroES (HSP10)
VLLTKDEHPERTSSGLYIPQTAWRYDPNEATVEDSSSSLVGAGQRVLYYGWAVAVHLSKRHIILSERDLIAEITGIRSLSDIRTLNGWEAVLCDELPSTRKGLFVPDTLHQTYQGTVLTGEHAGKRTAFPVLVGVAYRGDIEGVRFSGILVFVKKGAIQLVWNP